MIAEHEPEITNTNKQELIVKVFHTINVEAHFIYDISTKSFKILLSNVGSFIFSKEQIQNMRDNFIKKLLKKQENFCPSNCSSKINMDIEVSIPSNDFFFKKDTSTQTKAKIRRNIHRNCDLCICNNGRQSIDFWNKYCHLYNQRKYLEKFSIPKKNFKNDHVFGTPQKMIPCRFI